LLTAENQILIYNISKSFFRNGRFVISAVYFYVVEIYKNLIRPILFLFKPETIHHFVLKCLRLIYFIPGTKYISRKIYVIDNSKLHRIVFGIDFPNPVGLAAGFDKDGIAYNDLANLGFGFIEVGTVTPLAQPGNEKPRMFRLPADNALINRMGFNNDGVSALALRLKNHKPNIIIGGNIGKNKNTPNENAITDYEICFRELFPDVDYFAVNVSSPNTPGLRTLQDKGPLLEILKRLQQINEELSAANKIKRKPILLKIAPDLSNTQLDEIVEVIIESELNGIIATNTTISRENLLTSKNNIERAGAGGLSGKPLTKRSTEVIKYLSQKANKRFHIIGVGGIHSPEDAIEKLNAGADLIQLYTGFIYEGPGLIKKINKAILLGC
jgi:dihydroorotate dehydrogenase